MSLASDVLLVSSAIILIALIGLLIKSSIRVYAESERGVRLRLGKVKDVLGPGVSFVIPFIDETRTVDVRERALELPEMRLTTKDGMVVFADAHILYRITAPERCVTRVDGLDAALRGAAEACVRNVVAGLTYEELGAKREFAGARLREALNSCIERWGVESELAELGEAIPSQASHELITALSRAKVAGHGTIKNSGVDKKPRRRF